MQIVERKIEELSPYERNAKRHGERQLQELTKSIQRYGFRNPVLIDKDGTIIAGHGRVEAAKRAGLEYVPCVCYDDMTPEEVREYRIADNRLAEIGGTGWDFEALDFELSELDFGELDLEFNFGESESLADMLYEKGLGDGIENAPETDSFAVTLIFDKAYESAVKDYISKYGKAPLCAAVLSEVGEPNAS